MRQFSSRPMGKDLKSIFETPYGVIQFEISNTNDLMFEDVRSGWSFNFGMKDILAYHRIIRDDKEKVINFFSSDLDFMNIALTMVDVIIFHKNPKVANILGHKRFNPSGLGPDVEVTWYPVPLSERRIDRFYVSLI